MVEHVVKDQIDPLLSQSLQPFATILCLYPQISFVSKQRSQRSPTILFIVHD
jgi:hypothetical protein